jgi:two-component SAPR family response regulator
MPSRLNGLSILVLEDNFILADEIARMLEDAGAIVIGPFPRAASAIENLAKRRPDCALLDINLGSGPSFAAANAARKLGIPFVLTTGYEETDIPHHLASAAFLGKPIKREDLERVVAEVCR